MIEVFRKLKGSRRLAALDVNFGTDDHILRSLAAGEEIVVYANARLLSDTRQSLLTGKRGQVWI